MYAVFAIPKRKGGYAPNMESLPRCDPLDFGRGEEMHPELLLRRGRIGVFKLRCEARHAIERTAAACKGQDWLKKYGFIIIECTMRDEQIEEEPTPCPTA